MMFMEHALHSALIALIENEFFRYLKTSAGMRLTASSMMDQYFSQMPVTAVGARNFSRIKQVRVYRRRMKGIIPYGKYLLSFRQKVWKDFLRTQTVSSRISIPKYYSI